MGNPIGPREPIEQRLPEAVNAAIDLYVEAILARDKYFAKIKKDGKGRIEIIEPLLAKVRETAKTVVQNAQIHSQNIDEIDGIIYERIKKAKDGKVMGAG
jgi:hypothetical protein